MKQQRKARAKSDKKPKFPQKAPKNNYFATLMQTEEGRELRKQCSNKPRKNAGRPKGVPDGYTKHEIDPIRAKAKKEAKEVVKIMAEKYEIEDEYGQEALQTAVEIMRVPGETRERLAAARLVMEYTKSKPVSKSEVAVSKAEDFLASLLDEEKADGPETEAGS